jgi:predicted amidohydrolase
VNTFFIARVAGLWPVHLEYTLAAPHLPEVPAMNRPALLISLLGVILMASPAHAGRVVTLSTTCLLNGDKYENLDYVLAQMACVPKGTDLLVLPHMPFLSFRGKVSSRDLQPFIEFARTRHTYLALALAEQTDGQTYQTAVLLDREGRIKGRYRKTHCVADEKGKFSLGDVLPVFSTDFGKVGLTIGSDFYFPEVYQVLALKGADVVTWHQYPERLRDHTGWQQLLQARCFDGHIRLVTAMYAAPTAYITQNWGYINGCAWGRSMILNRVGIPIAETGFEDGYALATVDLDKRKEDLWWPGYEGENLFWVNNYGDRKAFAPVAEPYRKPKLPKYVKRTCRLAVGWFNRGESWRNGVLPERMFKLIERIGAVQPDMIVLSENSCADTDAVTRQAMQQVGDLARKLKCYICVGGVGDKDQISLMRVWDRSGKEIYGQPLYWPKGFPEIKVFDTDFGRVGSHECGDLYIPEFDRTLALLGAEIIIDGSQMWGPDGLTNENMLRARALDNSVWIACAHWPQPDPSLRSVIVDPYGQVVSASTYEDEGFIYRDLNLEQQRVYYAGKAAQQQKLERQGLQASALGDMPDQLSGWREMMFAQRRPELYSILPTVNEVTNRYRPAKNPTGD